MKKYFDTVSQMRQAHIRLVLILTFIIKGMRTRRICACLIFVLKCIVIMSGHQNNILYLLLLPLFRKRFKIFVVFIGFSSCGKAFVFSIIAA